MALYAPSGSNTEWQSPRRNPHRRVSRHDRVVLDSSETASTDGSMFIIGPTLVIGTGVIRGGKSGQPWAWAGSRLQASAQHVKRRRAPSHGS